MTRFIAVPLPQASTNDPSAELVVWLKESGERVEQGEAICRAETTKAIFDVEAPVTGFLIPVVAAGSQAEAGQTIAVIASVRVGEEVVHDWLAQQQSAQQALARTEASATRWTLKAEALARQHSLDLTSVEITSRSGRITEADVLAYLKGRQNQGQPEISSLRDLMDDRFPVNRVQRLLLVGGGDGAVQVMDVLSRSPRQRAVAIMDDNPALQGKLVGGVPVVGAIDLERALELHAAGEFDAAIICISTNISFKARIFDEWHARGIPFANVIDPSTTIGLNVRMGQGNLVMSNCRIGTCATVGDNNFLSAFCDLEHHNQLGSHCSFGPGVATSSKVRIGDRVKFGTGIFVEPMVEIGDDCVIGSGCAIWENIPARSTLKTRPNYVIRRHRDDSHPQNH